MQLSAKRLRGIIQMVLEEPEEARLKWLFLHGTCDCSRCDQLPCLALHELFHGSACLRHHTRIEKATEPHVALIVELLSKVILIHKGVSASCNFRSLPIGLTQIRSACLSGMVAHAWQTPARVVVHVPAYSAKRRLVDTINCAVTRWCETLRLYLTRRTIPQERPNGRLGRTRRLCELCRIAAA